MARITGKHDLAKRIAEYLGVNTQDASLCLTPTQMSEVLDATLLIMSEVLEAGGEIRLVNFGSFKVKQTAARTGVNPQNHKFMVIPSKDRVRFSPGKGLAESVQQSRHNG